MSVSFLCKYKIDWWELKYAGCEVVLQAADKRGTFGGEDEASWLKWLWSG